MSSLHPIVEYLIIGGFSLIVALLTFWLGESVAEIANQKENTLGFKAGGALAGFLIVFLLSPGILRRLKSDQPKKLPITIRVPVNDNLPIIDHPSMFAETEDYRCEYWLYDTDSGVSRHESNAHDTWENGHLTIWVRDVTENDLVRVRVQRGDETWESGDFPWNTRETSVRAADSPR